MLLGDIYSYNSLEVLFIYQTYSITDNEARHVKWIESTA